MLAALLMIFLGLVCCAALGIPILAVVLVAIVVIALVVTMNLAKEKKQKENADDVVRAELIEKIAIQKKIDEHTGYTLSWSGYRRDHFRYKNVVDHYECVFKVVYKNGVEGTITCVKDSWLYNELIAKK